jgi:D-alanyl-D-alanine carboxypeptidase/D-alanyl-D-alanine-endopeptidase (penicillin-binding protein 4)
VITGGVPLGGPSHVDAAVDQPEALALAYFTDALRRRGITVLDTQAGVPGLGTVVWRHVSEPLSAMLADMWQPSDNLIAEELLRELDVATNAHPGTIEGGAAVERAWLRAIGVDPATLTIADGSGLSQYDRVTPRALAAILLHDWRGPNHRVALDALPVAGVRGDLRGAMQGSTAVGRVFAKTGSMMHVRGLAGFVDARSGGTLIFALNVDDWMGTDADMAALRTAIAVRLAQ